MSNFLKALSVMMIDRQEFDLKVKKIKDDLVVMVNPDVKGKGKLVHITIPAEDLNDEIDSKFFGELNGPVVSEKATYQTATTEAPEGEEDEEEEETESEKKEVKKPEVKTKGKAAAKKTSAKATAKTTPKVEEKAEEETCEEETASEDKTSGVQKIEGTVTSETESVTNKDETVTEASEPEENKMSKEFVKDVTAAVEKSDYDLNTTQSPDKDFASDKSPQVKTEEEDAPDPDEIFAHFMAEGKRLFDDRKYEASEKAYQQAVDLFPDHEKAKSALANSKKWVAAIERMNLK